MTLAAATALDVDVRLLAATPADCAADVWPVVEIGDPSDEAAVRRFAEACDVVTFDHELVPPPLVEALSRSHAVRPGPTALRAAQDKAHQRRRFADLGLPVPAFAVGDVDDARRLAERVGWPLTLKAPRGGYDGRGVAVATAPEDLQAAWRSVGGKVPVLVEEHLPLDREVAVLLARRPSGETATWAVVETVQRDGILTELLAPAAVPAELAARAVDLAGRIADAIDAVGVLAVELFVVDGALLVNEVALRPHNSGHWTIEGSVTSQFEQHLRAVLDWPLGDVTATAAAAVTVNVLGPADGSDPRRRLDAALAVRGAHVHLYGKTPRPGRKLGHVTVCGDDGARARADARRAAAILEGAA